MRLYNQLVPHSWTPTIKLYKFLVQEIRNTGAVNHIGEEFCNEQVQIVNIRSKNDI